MRKLFVSTLACVIACLMAACSGGSTPSATAEKYAHHVMKGEYKEAIDMIHFKGTPEEVQQQKDFYLRMIDSKVKDGLPEDKQMTKYEVISEEIDEENGKATVTANVTYANGETKEDKAKLVKTDDGWQIDGEK